MTSQLTTTEDKLKSVRDTLASAAMQEQLRMALPKHVSPERIARIYLTSIRRTPKLLDCTRSSLFGALMETSQLGLEPGTLGHAWIIPYKTEATLIVGYRGMLDLAWRSAKIKSVFVKEVYTGDFFEWSFGLDPVLNHQPNPDADRSKMTHVYAVIKTTGGGTLFDVMTLAEVEAIRERSRAKSSGPWVTDYAEMAKKTVLRRLMKLAPCSAELQRAVTLDEQAEYGISQGLSAAIDVTPEPEGDGGDGEKEGTGA
jgi:recombination protein RecT